MTMQFRVLCSFAFLLILSSCLAGAPPPAGQPTGAEDSVTTLAPISDEEAIAAILQAESQGVLQQDMELLASLWLDDSMVTDARHTADDPGDDAVWHGIDAIMDRYVVLVFPGNPQVAAPQILSLEVIDDEAVVRSTTHIGDEVSYQGDEWRLRKIDGRWAIVSLTYNLESVGG